MAHSIPSRGVRPIALFPRTRTRFVAFASSHVSILITTSLQPKRQRDPMDPHHSELERKPQRNLCPAIAAIQKRRYRLSAPLQIGHSIAHFCCRNFSGQICRGLENSSVRTRGPGGSGHVGRPATRKQVVWQSPRSQKLRASNRYIEASMFCCIQFGKPDRILNGVTPKAYPLSLQ